MANESAAPGTPGNALTAPVNTGNVPAVAEQASSLPAIVRRNVQVLRPIADAIVLVQVQAESRDLIGKLLKDGKDFGVVPGVKKPSLFKPGAEKFNAAYGLVARFTVVEKEVDHYVKIDWTKTTAEWSGPKGQRRKTDKVVNGTSFGLYRYVINCELIDRSTGEVVGSSLGSASTLESKYVDRPRDLENTIIKMAEKRAYIGATLLTHALSEQFTQDVEDTGVASDDTQAVSVQPQDDQQNLPEVGSAAWAIGYEIPSAIHKKMKLADDVTTFGQMNWKQLDAIVAGCEALIQAKPEKKPVYDEVIRAARRMQEELEERAALADDGATGAQANPTDAAGSNAPTATTPAAGDATTTATKNSDGTASEFQPLKSDGGGVPSVAEGLPAALADEDDDLPF